MIDNEIQQLRLKIQKLEARITSLRLGRRILMNLLVELENSKNLEIKKLNHEIQRLTENTKNDKNGLVYIEDYLSLN